MTETAELERQARFEALVTRAESISKANPRDYRQRVIALAVLGHTVLLGTVAALVSVLACYVWAIYHDASFREVLFSKALIFPIAVLIFVLGRAVWARVEPPAGHRISRKSFPRLFKEIDELSAQLKTPAIHEVRLNTDLNATVVQQPRLGPFGWSSNTLVLGLPLLMALTPAQARAVLAHELGHLSARHGRSQRWLYQARSNWSRVMDAYAGNESWGGGLMRRFFEWYAPYFGAYSFVLARSFEYEADAVAAQLTSAEETAMALVSSQLKGGVAGERFWRPLEQLAERQPEPVKDAYTRLARFFLEYRPRREELLERISDATTPVTGPTDTHPSLRDRLSALGAPPDLPRPMHATAAEQWLGDHYPRVLKKLDAAWAADHAEEWQERYHQAESVRRKLEQLRRRPLDSLSGPEVWQLAELTERYAPDKDALGLYWNYHRRCPSDSAAELALGRVLLSRNDPRGLPFVKHAAESPQLLVAAARLAIDYLERAGDQIQASLWQRRMDGQLELERAAARERAGVRVSDTFEPSGLSRQETARVQAALRGVKGVDSVYLARKRLNHFPERPFFLLACTLRHGQSADRVEADILARAKLPGQAQVVWMRGATRRLAEKVMHAGDSLR